MRKAIETLRERRKALARRARAGKPTPPPGPGAAVAEPKAPGEPRPPEAGKGAAPGAPTTQPGPAEPKVPEGYQPCPPGFDLTCILKSGASRWAIINGQIVDIGQTVNEAKVLRIFPESVEMELNGERFMLHIGQQSGQEPKPPAPPTDQPSTDGADPPETPGSETDTSRAEG